MLNVKFGDKKIFVNGEEKLIIAGEIHYFRLKVADWEDRIISLKEAGFNSVATYIPWSIHEQEMGNIDLVGNTKEQYNLKLFCELVEKHGLYLIPRPGPFVMAETTGDGVPFWLSENFDDVNLKCWDGKDGTTVTRDYLSKSFLKYSEIWLEAVFNILKPFYKKNILAIQLDNEIGMLSWVSNCPDFNDNNIKMLSEFILEKGHQSNYSFDVSDIEKCTTNFRSPNEEDAIQLHMDLGYFNRDKFERYTSHLENLIYGYGFNDVPLLINIHGTGGGKLYGYPIGLSQLIETYSEKPHITAGSDLYFDDVSLKDFHEWYLASCLTEATLDASQPLSSLELNATSNDFGNSVTNRKLNSSLEIQVSILLSQNNKMLNFYLFTGGFNDQFNKKVNDGRNRIANTGELHGYGAPIGPTGKKAYFYEVMENVGHFNQVLGNKYAKMLQVKDNVGFGFIPDYYMTEFKYPGSEVVQDYFRNVEKNRSNIIYETVFKYSLIKGYQPDCVNIQKHVPDHNKIKVLMLPCAKFMNENAQRNAVDYAKNGGKLILVGEVPLFDIYGRECSILADYLKLSVDESYVAKKFTTAVPSGYLEGVSPSHFVYESSAIKSDLENESILDIYDSNSSCGLHITTKESEAVFISCFYRVDQEGFDVMFKKLGLEPKLKIIREDIGTYSLISSNKDESILSVFNFDEVTREIDITYNNESLFGNKKFTIKGRKSKFLPIGLKYDNYTIKYATEEILKLESNKITFKLLENQFRCEIITDLEITCTSEFVTITKTNDGYIVEKSDRLMSENNIELLLKGE